MSVNFLKERLVRSRLPSADAKRLVVLTGARQTGKTTLLQTVYPNLRYINLDAPENRELVRSVSSFQWHQVIGNAILDEAHKEPSVLEKTKFAFDAEQIHFSVLSGSAQILLLRQVREVLSGRVFLYELHPLLLCELLTDAPAGRLEPPLAARLLQGQPLAQVLDPIPSRLSAEAEDRALTAENYLLQWGGI